MQYEGMIYRPPSEARSLLVQVTIGCAHNKCTFCTMYKDKKFRIRKKEDVIKDLYDTYERYGDHIDRIFLCDGDALIIPTDDLVDILGQIKELFPKAKRVTSYGTPQDVLRKTKEELSLLEDMGLKMIYMGAESGDSHTLKLVDKGATREEIIEAGIKLKECRIQSSITLISGLGGRERMEEHAIESATLINAIQPDYVGFLTLMLNEPASIIRRIEKGELSLLNPAEVVEEMRLFLNHIDSEGTIFRANHASNYVSLGGTLNKDVQHMLSRLEEVELTSSYRPEIYRGL